MPIQNGEYAAPQWTNNTPPTERIGTASKMNWYQ